SAPYAVRRGAVNSLQPRTYRQLGKPVKLSKNECVFTCPDFLSQHFFRTFMCFVFNRVQLVHRRAPKFCATLIQVFCRLPFGIDSSDVGASGVAVRSRGKRDADVNISAETSPRAGFGRRSTA